MENNASNSATTSSKKDDIMENRKRSPKNRNSRQSHKRRRTYSKKSKSGDKKKAYSPQLDINNSFKVEIITTSDSNDDAKKSKKRISRDKDISEQIKLSSCDEKKSRHSSQCTTPVLVKEENNASNLDDENNEACMDSIDDDAMKSKNKMCKDKYDTEETEHSSDDDKKSTDSSQCGTPVLVKEENNASNLDSNYDDEAKKSKNKMCRDKDVTEEIKLSPDGVKKCTDSSQFDTSVLVKEENNASNLDDENDTACIDSNDDDAKKQHYSIDKNVTEEMELSSDDDKTSTDSSQFDTSVSVKEENNASNLDVHNIKKRARTDDDEDDDDYSGHKQKYRMYHSDKRNTQWEQSTSGRRLNQSLPSNIAHSTPVREYRHSQNQSYMSYTTPRPYRIYEVAPIYNGFQLLGDSQLLRFSQQLLPGRKNIYSPGYKLGPRRWGYCVSGQLTSELLERLIQDECPLGRKVIVLIGTNDLLRKTPIEILCNNYLSLVNLLKEKTETIILLTVPPVPKLAADPNHWVILQKVNTFINEFMDNEKVYCLDVASIYISYNNSTSMDYYEKTFNNNNEKKDYIHLNRFGFKMIQTMINHLLKSNHLY